MNHHENNITALLKNRADRQASREERRRKRTAAARLAALAFFLAVLLTALLVVLVTPVAGEEVPLALPVISPDIQAGQEDPEPQEDFENEKIESALLARSTKLENVTVTHYDLCAACCGKTDGVTASGVKAVPGVTVSVDPSVIPLGSDVLVDYGDGEVHYYRATDTGGSVCGDHIDLCVSSHEEAVELGVRTATVWWCEP